MDNLIFHHFCQNFYKNIFIFRFNSQKILLAHTLLELRILLFIATFVERYSHLVCLFVLSLGHLTLTSFVVLWRMDLASSQMGRTLSQFWIFLLQDHVGTGLISCHFCMSFFILFPVNTVY